MCTKFKEKCYKMLVLTDDTLKTTPYGLCHTRETGWNCIATTTNCLAFIDVVGSKTSIRHSTVLSVLIYYFFLIYYFYSVYTVDSVDRRGI